MTIDRSAQKAALLHDSIRFAQAVPTADKPPRWVIGNPRLEDAWRTVIRDHMPKSWPAAIAIFKNYCKKHAFPLPIAAEEEIDNVRTAQAVSSSSELFLDKLEKLLGMSGEYEHLSGDVELDDGALVFKAMSDSGLKDKENTTKIETLFKEKGIEFIKSPVNPRVFVVQKSEFSKL